MIKFYKNSPFIFLHYAGKCDCHLTLKTFAVYLSVFFMLDKNVLYLEDGYRETIFNLSRSTDMIEIFTSGDKGEGLF